MIITKKQKMINRVKYIFVYGDGELLHIAKNKNEILPALANPELRVTTVDGLDYKMAKHTIHNFFINNGYECIKKDYAYRKGELLFRRSVSLNNGRWLLEIGDDKTIFANKKELINYVKESLV